MASGTTNPVEKIRLFCLARGVNGILTLGKRFKIMDDNRSGSLDMAEFCKGIREISGEKGVSDAELKQMFDMFDRDGNGTISYNEFLREMRPPLNEIRLSLISQAFNKMDKSGDAIISYQDIKGIYNARRHPQVLSGEKTERQVVIKFLNTFESESFESPDVEPTVDGKITWEEFLNYYSGVSASIDEDPYFDLMIRTAWDL